jgi:hypothetical protein
LNKVSDYLHALSEGVSVTLADFPISEYIDVGEYFLGVRRALARSIFHFRSDDDLRVRIGLSLIEFASEQRVTRDVARVLLKSLADLYAIVIPGSTLGVDRQGVRHLADFLGLMARVIELDGHLPGNNEDAEWERPTARVLQPVTV